MRPALIDSTEDGLTTWALLRGPLNVPVKHSENRHCQNLAFYLKSYDLVGSLALRWDLTYPSTRWLTSMATRRRGLSARGLQNDPILNAHGPQSIRIATLRILKCREAKWQVQSALSDGSSGKVLLHFQLCLVHP